MNPIDTFLNALPEGRTFRKSRDRWMCVCPAHDDRSPSLSVEAASDGRVLIHCFAGCDSQSVVEAVGLRLSDLFPPDDNYRPRQDKLRSEVNAANWSEDRWFVECVKADIAAGKAIPEKDKRRYQSIVSRKRAA